MRTDMKAFQEGEKMAQAAYEALVKFSDHPGDPMISAEDDHGGLIRKRIGRHLLLEFRALVNMFNDGIREGKEKGEL